MTTPSIYLKDQLDKIHSVYLKMIKKKWLKKSLLLMKL